MSITLQVQPSESCDFTDMVITHKECDGGYVRIRPNRLPHAYSLDCEKCNLTLSFKEQFSKGENIIVDAANNGKEGTFPGDYFWDCPGDTIVVAAVESQQ
mgnify:FL=1